VITLEPTALATIPKGPWKWGGSIFWGIKILAGSLG
jgi:hypothetical protein